MVDIRSQQNNWIKKKIKQKRKILSQPKKPYSKQLAAVNIGIEMINCNKRIKDLKLMSQNNHINTMPENRDQNQTIQ